ncbi:hypothetical protein [Streptomyces sp. NPDC057694]|uniref:hypothetical protein n=1 Tax=Streptomyces sp. NPDC057694 TaxID=3346216 RepID=UPI0036BC9FE6
MLSYEWEEDASPVALWSAQRLLSGDLRDEERTGLLLCLWMGIDRTDESLPPAYARYARAALAAIDVDATRAHPDHPWSALVGDWNDQERAVMHLYAPGGLPENPIPAELSVRELWDCPVQHAEPARTALTELGGTPEDEDA